MKFFSNRWSLLTMTLMVGLMLGACSRLLPARKGTAHSFQLVLDTRRAPVVELSGCFIPAVFPAITKIPIVYAVKVPPNAIFKEATVEVLNKNGGEMKVLETSIENNQVYLKFAVPAVDSYIQYNVLVRVKYEYQR